MTIELQLYNHQPATTMTKSKRLKFSMTIIAINFLFGIYGIHAGTDLGDLGTFLALVNTPLYVYVLGETYRPSGSMDHEH
jgi:hypothetical protein